ncbi:hypothetical protein ST47_g3860 [Ascochyta rabiei]|uniref:Uncharacterized protein n=1 Tax=Didymella rabiei TaxID=5454 RepID=A0A163GRD6_DIDRA|nr:hypothetical protein ST47_g3860 [Ascochyta rabiei]
MLHLFKLLALLSLTTLILALPTGPPPLSTSATLKHQPNHPNSAPPRKSLTVALSTTKLEATKRPPQSKCILICTHAHCDLLCANPHTTTSLPVSTSSANPTITNTTSTSSTASTNINTNITTTVPQPAHLTISSLSSGMDAVILDPRSQTGQMQRCAWTCSAATGVCEEKKCWAAEDVEGAEGAEGTGAEHVDEGETDGQGKGGGGGGGGGGECEVLDTEGAGRVVICFLPSEEGDGKAIDDRQCTLFWRGGMPRLVCRWE